MVRVVIVEDRDVVRRGIVQSIDGHGDPPITVVGEAANVDAALKLASRGFDVALVDLGLPDGSGHDVIRHYCEHAPHARSIVLTMIEEPEQLFEALRAGARGYLLKESPPPAIRSAIVDVARGGSPLTPRMARFIVDRFASPPSENAPQLTQREVDVLSVLSNGLSYSEAAGVLGIGVGTVQTHVKSLYRKLEVSSKTEAVAEALRHGLVEL